MNQSANPNDDGQAQGPAIEPTFAVPPSLPGQGHSHEDSRLLRAILAQLQEFNDNILMTDGQRLAKGRQRRDELRGGLLDSIRRAFDVGDCAAAGRALATLADRIPDDEHIEPLRERLVYARQAAMASQVAAITTRIGDLMATGSFDQAEAEALAMTRRFPDEPEIAGLLDRVRREKRAFNDERQERMYSEVVRLAEARQWRQALGAARRYTSAFPGGTGAETVRTMLATIEDNARIEEVRELRDSIRDLIERRRYPEAVEYAQDVIKRFPDTRAAEELGGQMCRLRELARSSSSNSAGG